MENPQIETWQQQFRYWIKTTQEKIVWWTSKDPSIVVAKDHLQKEGFNFDKMVIEKWQAQIKAWQSDLDEFKTIDEFRETDPCK